MNGHETVKLVVMAWFLTNMIFGITLVGKRRDPLTPGVAAMAACLYLGLVWAVWRFL